MAENSLLSIQPHQVSRDMRGYSVFLYGDAKSGKTTLATRFPNHLLLAAEKGYSAIPGAMAKPINSWSEFKKTLRELKDDEVKARFSTIIVDTVDIVYDYCEKYICANAGVDSIGEIGYGKGYRMAAKELDEALRSIVQMNYGLVLISHATDKTFKDQNGIEYNQIVPTLDSKPRNVVSRLCDIIGYTRIITDENGAESVKMFMRGTPRFVAGSRFKYTPDYIDLNYDALVNAICDAIDRQAEEDGQKYFTDTRNNLYIKEELDFDALMTKFQELVSNLMSNNTEEKFNEYYYPRITQITEKYLGKGMKVSQCSREQVEALDLIVTELSDLT